MTERENSSTTGGRSLPRRRRAWLAALLGFFAPGAGQLYNGEPRAAIAWFAVFAVLTLGYYFGLPNFHPDLPVLGVLLALVLGGLLFEIAAAVHAFIHARRAAPAPLRSYQRGWLYGLMVIALPVLAFAAAPQWIKGYNVPSASNLPTLLVGDRFYAELGYSHNHPPQRGEVAVFRLAVDNGSVYVKRIVGLPGDTVQMRDGVLYLNGAAAPRKPLEDYPSQFDGSPVMAHQYVETLPGGASYRILQMGDHGPLDNTPVFTVPPGNYFALGDNRSNSLDSRVLSEFGYVPAAKLIGRAYIVYWPLARLGTKLN